LLASEVDDLDAFQAVARGLGIKLNKKSRGTYQGYIATHLKRLYWAQTQAAEAGKRHTTHACIPQPPGQLNKTGEVDMMHRHVGGVVIDLVDLVKLVRLCGGPQVVTECRGWLSLGIALGVPSDGRSKHAATSTRLRTLYNYAVEQLRTRRADLLPGLVHMLCDAGSNVDLHWLGSQQSVDDGCRQSQDWLDDLSSSDPDKTKEDEEENEGWNGWGEGACGSQKREESEKCKAEEWKSSLSKRHKTCKACSRHCFPTFKSCPWCSASFADVETGDWKSAPGPGYPPILRMPLLLEPRGLRRICLEGERDTVCSQNTLETSLPLRLPLADVYNGGSVLQSGEDPGHYSGGRSDSKGQVDNLADASPLPAGAAGQHWTPRLSDVPGLWLHPQERNDAGLSGLGSSLFCPWVHI
jgi:hypothetical protein